MVWVSSLGWRFDMRSGIAASALAIAMLMTVRAFAHGPETKPQKGSQSASNPQLAAEINRLFNGDLKDALPNDQVHSRVRLILAEHGVPKTK
jgi:hypothetical protein